MNKLVLGIIVLVLGALSFAETPSATGIKTPPEASARLNKKTAQQETTQHRSSAAECAFTFTSGSDLTFLQYCVTANGNIIEFETPKDITLIAAKDLGEGYGVCDVSTKVAYSDYGGLGDSGNWRPAKVLHHNATSVKIARTTSDGLWTLTQTITQVAGKSPSTKIAMALRNNGTEPKEALLVRYADADAAGQATNNFDTTLNSAFAWNSLASENAPFGLELQNLGTVTFGYAAFAQDVPDAPSPCAPVELRTRKPVSASDGSLFMFYDMVDIPASGTANVTVAYKGW